ncbi:hypothetical protein WG29040_05580 [Pseudomonas sp. PAMC 29040]|uniref:DUF4376 domain-containing protein n=1 Tax=Pseudomonas sp. PAMC 29040 TaxID=2498450 RepID=UPI000F90ABCE|nr:hypothetical protein [Pseudomonas sp. PAMC 29040]RUT39789.1 hypothetical protein WG29040_05580 [Pseudomonas sp. PAMC 29040]
MNTRTVYQTNHLGLYVGPVEAEESPMEPGVFLIPGGCVQVPPPTDIPALKAACWTGKRWQLLDYLNGLIVYNMATLEPLTLTGVGTIPDGYTVQKPEPGQIWKNGGWVDDLNTMLAKLYPQKLAEIKSGCTRYIESGFNSDALGELYRYDSVLEDQVNLTGLILSGFDALCPCYGDDAEKVFREHNAGQLHVVGQHLVTHKQGALQQAESLKKALSKALAERDLPAMKAIGWLK